MRQCAPPTPRRRYVLVACAVCVVLLCGGTIPAAAQGNDAKWGLTVSFTPKWRADQRIQDLLLVEGDSRFEGSEFTIGIARGSHLGGDWGVSYVRKPVDDVTIREVDEFVDDFGTSRATYSRAFRDVYYEGVELHKFWAIATIARRVQLGINIAGGVARVEGEVDETFEFFNEFRPPNGPVEIYVERDDYTGPAAEHVYKYQPLGKLEAQAAIIVAPALKLKVSGGVNAPGTFSMRLGAVVLFGG